MSTLVFRDLLSRSATCKSRLFQKHFKFERTFDSTMFAALRTIRADITTLNVDAILNTSSRALLPSNGMCRAIRHTAGFGDENLTKAHLTTGQFQCWPKYYPYTDCIFS